MYKFTFLFFLLFTSLAFAQYDVEEQMDGLIYNERGVTLLFVKIELPFTHFIPRGCADASNFSVAEFPGGDEAFLRLLRRNIIGYIDRERYALQGSFNLLLQISESGKITDIVMGPAVKNSKLFFDDMRFAVRRIKGTWKPAQCGATATNSQINIKLNFNNEIAE